MWTATDQERTSVRTGSGQFTAKLQASAGSPAWTYRFDDDPDSSCGVQFTNAFHHVLTLTDTEIPPAEHQAVGITVALPAHGQGAISSTTGKAVGSTRVRG